MGLSAFASMVLAHILSESELLTLRGKQPIFVNAISNGLHA